jgi:hypothetical protein
VNRSIGYWIQNLSFYNTILINRSLFSNSGEAFPLAETRQKEKNGIREPLPGIREK